MKTKETEYNTTLDIVTNENTNLSEEIKIENIKNTPFSIITQGADHYGVIGTHRITEKYNDIEECKKEVTTISWDRITQVIWAVAEKYKEFNNEINN